MRVKEYLLLFTAGVFIISIFAYFQTAPGYMDAEYYYAMGLRIARDKTISEPFIWNYLNGYLEIPAPGFVFWMPLPALITALSLLIPGGYSFQIARIGFIFLAALIPVLTAYIAICLIGNKRIAIFAGCFALFGGFYTPFLSTSDGFGLAMVIGAFFIIVSLNKDLKYKYLILGLLIGVMHLTRTEGFIWMIAGIYLALSEKNKAIPSMVMLLVGYMIMLAPWFGRNLANFGSLFPPGSSKMLWLTSYDDLFIFDPDTLNRYHLFEHDVYDLIQIRWDALLSNIKTAIIIQWQVILLPFIIIGFIKEWGSKVIRSIGLVWIAVLAIMSFAFPFAGPRGGFFHSGAAFQPLFWVIAVSGLGAVIEWGKSKRGWVPDQAQYIIGFGFTIILAGMTLFVLKDRVIGSEIANPQWNSSYYAAVEIGDVLDQLGVPNDAVIMINNPPGLYIATERSSVVIPSGDIDQLSKALSKTEANYLILEKNHPVLLDELYRNPELFPQFIYLMTQSDAHYFMIP